MKKKRLLQPFRAIGRILRRKPRPPVISSSNGSVDVVTATLRSSKENFDACEQPLDSNWEPTNKSHSTSHLTDDTTDNSQRRYVDFSISSINPPTPLCTIIAFRTVLTCYTERKSETKSKPISPHSRSISELDYLRR